MIDIIILYQWIYVLTTDHYVCRFFPTGVLYFSYIRFRRFINRNQGFFPYFLSYYFGLCAGKKKRPKSSISRYYILLYTLYFIISNCFYLDSIRHLKLIKKHYMWKNWILSAVSLYPLGSSWRVIHLDSHSFLLSNCLRLSRVYMDWADSLATDARSNTFLQWDVCIFPKSGFPYLAILEANYLTSPHFQKQLSLLSL